MTLKGLHPVHGIAVVVDIENHDDAAGCKAAYGKALDKAFEVLAYTLHQRMARGEVKNNHANAVAAYQNAVAGEPMLITPPAK